MMALLEEYSRQSLSTQVEPEMATAQVLGVLKQVLRKAHSRLGYFSLEDFIRTEILDS